MKILQVTNFFKPSWESGGPARMAYELSIKFIKRGHEVTVYTTDGYKSKLNVETNKQVNVDGIRTYYFRSLSDIITQKLNLPISYYSPFVAMKEINGYDIIFIYDFRTILSLVVTYYANKFNVPYVLLPYGSLPKTMGFKGLCKAIYDIPFGYNMLKKCRKIIAQNNHEKLVCRNYGIDEGKIVLIPLGVNLSDFNELPAKGYFRASYSISPDEKIILFLGRIHPNKGIAILINAISQILKQGWKLRLIIVGNDDGFLADAMNLVDALGISDRVLFPGPIYDKTRIRAYIDADVFVLTPSFYEETSLAVLEACAAGIPVIITAQNEIPQFKSYNAGIMINYDQLELQAALIKLITDDVLRTTMGKNARKMIQELFNLDSVADEMENILTIRDDE